MNKMLDNKQFDKKKYTATKQHTNDLQTKTQFSNCVSFKIIGV